MTTHSKYLLIITILSFIVRIYQPNFSPLLWDEASIGYNAYSLIKSARDEHGSLLPLVFKSFGDYKPGFYIYLATPFVALFGLSPLSVRLPSIIAGSLLPLVIYYLIHRLSPASKKMALFTSLLLAFNPWNIHFSRGAWETNILLFELALASLLFLQSRHLLSAFIFGLTVYTYQGGKVFTPLMLLFLFYFYPLHRTIFTKFIVILLLMFSPIIFGLLFGRDSNRLQVFALWNYHRPTAESQLIIQESGLTDFNLFHNKVIYFSRNFLERYFNYFSPRFILFQGDWQIARHGPPYIGVSLLLTGLLFYLGILFTLKPLTPDLKFFIFLLLISPIPGALTTDIIQPVRTLPLSLALVYFSARGLIFLFTKFSRPQFKIIFLLLLTINFGYYLDLYFNHYLHRQPSHVLYGYQPAINFVINNLDGRQVTFTDFYGQPYIYYLFYSQYPPQQYQQQARFNTDGLDVGHIDSIDNINFKTPDYSLQKSQPRQLLIFSYDDVLRQGIDFNLLIPLSPINGYSTFYAYLN